MKKDFCLLLPALLVAIASHATIKLPRLVRDSMVLQRDAPIRIWGWAAPGETVQVQFSKNKARTRADGSGNWSLLLPAMKAGGPYTMVVRGSSTITLNHILLGDVYLCAGQSNMVHQMDLHNIRYADDIAQAQYPEIRQFLVPNTTSLQGPQPDLPGGYWKPATPGEVGRFSAVAYFFARQLYEKYKVPIGIINASWGGTPIAAWLSEEGAKDFPQLLETIRQNQDTAWVNETQRKAAAAAAAAPKPAPDKGLSASPAWYDPAYAPKGWRNIHIPGYWEDQGIRDLDGTVWFRLEINLPASFVGQPAKVFLGRIADADFLYINGKLVGSTGYMYPQRRYAIPAGLLKAGRNLFVVRVVNHQGKGGFVPDKPYQLIAGKDTVELSGDWLYKVGQVFEPQREGSGASRSGIAFQNQPAALYNAMIAPLVGYGIRGICWYQGESDTGNPAAYAKMQPALIRDWRSRWQSPRLPFLFVQLPGFMDMQYLPAESGWAAFREAQAKSLALPQTAMAVAIDLGEWNDIHPDRKKEVGERLALAAEKLVYGDSVVYSGPLFESASIEGNRIRLHFTHTGGGLTTRDGEAPAAFAIAGADKKFVWANAVIENNSVVVWSDAVSQPLYLRYAWADNPVNPNLMNQEGLPASPFRTDP